MLSAEFHFRLAQFAQMFDLTANHFHESSSILSVNENKHP